MADEILTRPDATWTYREVADRSSAVKAELARRQIRMHRDSALSKILNAAEGNSPTSTVIAPRIAARQHLT